MTQQNPYAWGGGNNGPGQFGYGQNPYSSNRGFYEQQTPVGSFAAADPAAQAQQQRAGVYGVQSPNATANPYLGQNTQQASAATNSMAGVGNPYLTQAIDSASADAARNFNQSTMPQLDRMMAQSGSFGNAGVMQLKQNAMSDFGRNLGNIANSARMQDYTAQQNLAENLANRQTGVSQFNSGLNAGDLSRNLAGHFQGLGMNQAAGMFNAGALNNAGQFNAGQGNALNMFNTGQANNMNQFNANSANNMLNQNRSIGENARQFNNQFDYNAARNSYMDPMQVYNWQMGLNNQGLNTANQQQSQPMNQLLQLLQASGYMGGQGGSATTPYQGSPITGAMGGYMLGNNMFGP